MVFVIVILSREDPWDGESLEGSIVRTGATLYWTGEEVDLVLYVCTSFRENYGP